jgi:hypothetical protein
VLLSHVAAAQLLPYSVNIACSSSTVTVTLCYLSHVAAAQLLPHSIIIACSSNTVTAKFRYLLDIAGAQLLPHSVAYRMYQQHSYCHILLL